MVIQVLNQLETYVAIIGHQLELSVDKILENYFDGGNNMKKQDLKLIALSYS